MSGMTKRRREILDFIAEFMAEKRYSPSLDEIADAFGFSSTAAAHKHVERLERDGWVAREYKCSRSISLTDKAIEWRMLKAEALRAPWVGQVFMEPKYGLMEITWLSDVVTERAAAGAGSTLRMTT